VQKNALGAAYYRWALAQKGVRTDDPALLARLEAEFREQKTTLRLHQRVLVQYLHRRVAFLEKSIFFQYCQVRTP
jgi:hypothetical protein